MTPRLFLASLLVLGCFAAVSQSTLPLTDLTAFKSPSQNWRIVGNVFADLEKKETLTTSAGTGILVNLPEKKTDAKDLISNFEHGDMDIFLEYMVSKGSNSGVYLQGRYEVQLLDSWGVRNPGPGDNGGVYERWDDSRPQGQNGYEGHAPRQNVSKAPGLWQQLKISFQAPRFDASGRKASNAKMLLVELNGVVIQENVELTGPTRGGMGPEEVALGPLRLQGDHGSVAFRNIRTMIFDKPRPEVLNLKYSVYKGKFEEEPDFSKLPPEAEGSSNILSSNVSNVPGAYLIRYTGTLRIREAGDYTLNLGSPGGYGAMKINNQVLKPLGGGSAMKTVTLPAGDLPFELLYSKFYNLNTKASLGVSLAGPGVRQYLISDANITSGDDVDPILVHAPVNTILRCFVDLADKYRVVHAVSVGSPENIHYSFDLDNAMIVQVWRGDFLDATPMWHERGDGSSVPNGAVQRFGKPALSFGRLSLPQDAWQPDTTGSGYRPKGYMVDDQDRPTFRYMVHGASITDATRVINSGQGFKREITLQQAPPNLYMRLADGRSIEAVSENLYLVDDKSYYLRIDEASGKPVIRDVNGRKEMVIPVQNKLSYSILF